MGSIKYYLFTRFFGIVFIQIIILSGFSWKYFSADFFQESIHESFEQLKNVSKNVNYFYNHQLQELQRIVTGEGFHPYNRELAQKKLSYYLNARQLITSVHFYLEDGRLDFKAASEGTPRYHAQGHYLDHPDPNFRKYFEQSRQLHKISFSPPLHTNAGILYHVALIPVFKTKENKELLGLLSVGFFPSLNPLGHSLSGLSLNKNNFFTIVNEKGHILASNIEKSESLEKVMKDYIADRGESKGNPFKYKRKNVDNLRYRFADQNYYLLSVQVGDLPLFSVLSVNESVILGKRDKILRLIMAIIILSTLFGLFTTVVITGKISAGIEELVRSIRMLKSGTFSHKSESKYHQDFNDALKEVEDLSIEIEKGRLLGNLWGQEQLLRTDETNDKR